MMIVNLDVKVRTLDIDSEQNVAEFVRDLLSPHISATVKVASIPKPNYGQYIKEIGNLVADIQRLRFALLKIDRAARNFAISEGGHTPLAIIAKEARTSIGIDTVEESDAAYNAMVVDEEK